MRPYLLTGLAALTVVPLYAAITGTFTLLPGIEVAIVGLVWAAAVPILTRSGSIALRESARWMAMFAPGVMLSGLIWHAWAASDMEAWIGVIAVGVVLVSHGAALRRVGTLGWGVAAILCAATVPGLRGLATPWTLAIVVGIAGLVAAMGVAFANARSQST